MVKDYLKSVIGKEKDVVSKERERRFMWLRLEGRVLSKELMKSLEDYDREVNRLKLESFNNRLLVSEQIDSLEDVNHKIVLRERYMNGRKWDDIIDEMYYSTRRVYEIHNEALEEFKNMYL